MTELEREVAALRTQLNALAERVRLDAVAQAFLNGEHPICEGDFFLLNGTFPTKLGNVSSEGKWSYFDGQHYIEPFRIPKPGEHDRLYTITEVAEIVAKARGIAPRECVFKFSSGKPCVSPTCHIDGKHYTEGVIP